MITITGLDKYYNKGKNTELHVINNVTLSLPDTGLVAFLGKSGCGKTTLLNVIGGLDKQDSGEIKYGDESYQKYKMSKIDAYRKENIGYIFQNYLLIENMSVADNLREALEIIGIKDHDEQNKRIEYALQKVGLYRHRKKLAGRLSGGEMQRVSIARSLIKKCQVIIADEPTGNLDSENTIEIMNILKKISKTTLVLLVTHNENIASAYADRIIRIKDGTIISDSVNEMSGKYTNKNDKKIYLKDLNHQKLTSDELKIDFYNDIKYKDIELKIIIKNDTIYFDTNKKCVNASELGINLVDEHYQEDIKINEEKFDFDISWYNDKKEKNIFHSLKTSLRNSFKQFWYASKKTKTFRFIFFLIGIIMAGCVINYTNYLHLDDSKYQKADAYLIYDDDHFDASYPEAKNVDIKKLIDENYIQDIYSYLQMGFMINKKLNSSVEADYKLTAYIYPFSTCTNNQLLVGSTPITKDDLVISKKLADTIMVNEKLDNYKELLDYELQTFKICGIYNSTDTSVYVNDKYYVTNILALTGYDDDLINPLGENLYFGRKDEINYEIIKGEDIKNTKTEVLMLDELAYYYGFNIGDEISFDWMGENEYHVNFRLAGTFKTKQINFKYGFICDDEVLLKYQIDLENKVNDGYKTFENCLVDNYSLMNSGTFMITRLSDSINSQNNNYQLRSGTLPTNDNEVLVNEHLNIENGKTVYVYNKEYKVVGKYSVNNGVDGLYFLIGNDKAYLNSVLGWSNYMDDQTGYHLYSSYKINNLSELKEKLKEQKIHIKKIYDYQYSLEKYENQKTRISLLVTSSILLLIGVIYVYFSTRSKLLNNVKNIGVYRSIGKTRFQILKSYISDIFVETSMTSLLGYLIVMIGITYINTKVKTLTGSGIVSASYSIYLLGALLIYGINILIGILPVVRLMKNTPSEINSKYDL